MMKNFDYVGKKKYFGIAFLAIFAIGVILNVILGTKLDIQFTGGSIIKYSYEGDVDEAKAQDVLEDVTGATVNVEVNYDVYVAGEASTKNNLSASVSETDQLSTEVTTKMLEKLQKEFPNAKFTQLEASSVNPTMGREFFSKCLVAIVLASVLMLLYISFRFRKIGGWLAGVMALLALLIDISNAYFTFVVVGIPLDDNFVAVVLTILGYSLNDTIVIYDRIRENKRLMSANASIDEIVNVSIGQTFRRSLNTAITTFVAVLCVTIAALAFGLDSILSFAFPMLVGIVSGFFTSVFVTIPFWTVLEKKRVAHAEAKAASKSNGKKK